MTIIIIIFIFIVFLTKIKERSALHSAHVINHSFVNKCVFFLALALFFFLLFSVSLLMEVRHSHHTYLIVIIINFFSLELYWRWEFYEYYSKKYGSSTSMNENIFLMLKRHVDPEWKINQLLFSSCTFFALKNLNLRNDWIHLMMPLADLIFPQLISSSEQNYCYYFSLLFLQQVISILCILLILWSCFTSCTTIQYL